MTGIFLIILVPFFIVFIAKLMADPSERKHTDGGSHPVYFGSDNHNSDHCGSFDSGGFGGGDSGCGGGGGE
jgi:hypothetical protein